MLSQTGLASHREAGPLTERKASHRKAGISQRDMAGPISQIGLASSELLGGVIFGSEASHRLSQ